MVQFEEFGAINLYDPGLPRDPGQSKRLCGMCGPNAMMTSATRNK